MKPSHNFRSRLLLSHLLPILVVVPLLGYGLIYLLETQVILPSLASDLIDQGTLVEQLLKSRPEIWSLPASAQAMVASLGSDRSSTIELLNPAHRVLAASQNGGADSPGSLVQNLPANSALQNSWWSTGLDSQGGQILEALVPVRSNEGQITGLIWIRRSLTHIEAGFTSSKWLVLIALLVGALLAGLLAFLFANSVSRQLNKLTTSIANAPLEGPYQNLSETGDRELVELSKAYNRLQEHRRDLEETRQQMLANVIHEIGRPLGSLRTALHALRAGAIAKPDLREELLNGMSERVDRMGRLLEDLALTYRNLEPQEIHLKTVQVSPWLAALIPLWVESARQKQLQWQAILPENLPDLHTDPDRLAQVLSNLVNNAIKFTSAGGQITFTVVADKNAVRFLISDTGIGIPSEDQRHLFLPFYRSVQPPWKTPGLGLGLSIAKTLTESLGGKISLESVSQQGSTFTVAIPYK